MFNAVLRDPFQFRKLIESIKELVTSVNFDISSNGISLQAMDTSHIALVSLMLKEIGFQDFRCDKNITIGVNILNMLQILKCAQKDDAITMTIDQEDPAYLKFKFQNTRNIFLLDRQSQFTLNLEHLQSQGIGIPQTDFTSSVQMPSNDFAAICKQFFNMSKNSNNLLPVNIQTNKGYLKISYQGNFGNGSTMLHGFDNQKNGIKLQVQQPVSLLFGAKYFTQFNKAASLCDRVRLNLKPDTPLLVQFQLPNDMGDLKYYLAPKIDNSQ